MYTGHQQALLLPGVLALPPCPGTTQWPGRCVYIHWFGKGLPGFSASCSFSSFLQDGLNFAENVDILTLKTQEP